MALPSTTAALRRSLTTQDTYKTVLVLGCQYAGFTAVRALIKDLPEGWRAVVVERSSHFNHLYLLPRASIVNEHAHKAFIPIQQSFTPPHAYVQSTLLALNDKHAVVRLADEQSELSIPYTFCLYALGGTLPSPVDLSSGDGSKPAGIARLHMLGNKVASLPSGGRVLVIGGGALGIQLATDIKEVHPDKEVTLLHSRKKLLPRFSDEMHELIIKRFDELGVKAVLGERAIIPPEGLDGLDIAPKVVSTTAGTQIGCDLVLVCTGQNYQTHFLTPAFPEAVDEATRSIRVVRSMQAADATGTPVLGGRLFAAGDCVEAFGAIKAGHTAHYQALIAAANIVKLVRAAEQPEEKVELEEYVPGPPAIKVTLGRRHGAVESPSVGGVKAKDDGVEDLYVDQMWTFYGVEPDWEVPVREEQQEQKQAPPPPPPVQTQASQSVAAH